jgi:nucleoside-diphosphate-sugar epimerase
MIGATGFIGKEVVKQLALEDVSLTLLVRDQSRAASLKALAPSKIALVTGDLTQPNLGLDETDKASVLNCDLILHCGGPMDITLSETLAKKAFLEGSRYVMDLAKEIQEQKGLKKLIHVAGYMSPFNDEASVWEDTDVFNEVHPALIGTPPYEQMKFLSDIYMRQEAKKNHIPLAVINPPTVIGDDQTGDTAQLGGFGLFIKIIRGGSLPVIPGGKDYRLPLINKNIIAEFIVQTIFNETQEKMTYTLVSDKASDPDISDLMTTISESMHIKTPRLTVPFGLLKFVMTFGGSQLTGIPKSSLNFLTNRTFDNQLTKNDFEPELVSKLSASNVPLAIADIDFRLTYGEAGITPYTRTSLQGATVYRLDGKGKPLVLIHGLFSDGTDLFDLGLALNKQTAREIIIPDLPGFGKSPFVKSRDSLIPYLDLISSIKKAMPEGAIFIGHSFGAALLMEASNRNYLVESDKIILLQPPFKKIVKEPYSWLSKLMLKQASDKQLAHYFNRNGLLLTNVAKNDMYLKRVKASFNSPRILNTTLELNKVLKGMTLTLSEHRVYDVLWGKRDKSYSLPIDHEQVIKLNDGHFFPISNPLETATYISSLI